MNISHIIKYAWKSRKGRLPTSLILLVTGRCNAKCSFCIFKNSLNKETEDLSLSTYKKLSEELGELFRFHISGGETFLRDDLPEICRLFYINNNIKEIAIPTNGLLPAVIKRKTEEILVSCPNLHLMISLSLDGPREIHDQLRHVPGAFDKVMETYEELIELKKQYSNLRVHVTTTISKFNFEYLEELITLVKEKMPELNSHNFEFVRSSPLERCPDLPTIEQIKRFSVTHKQLVNSSHRHFNSKIKSRLASIVKKYKFDLLVDILEKQKQLLPCAAGQSIGVIDWRGDVYLCELLPKIGNIKEGGFKKVWCSETAAQQRKMIREKKCFCTHGCFQGSNILFQFRSYPKILKHWLSVNIYE